MIYVTLCNDAYFEAKVVVAKVSVIDDGRVETLKERWGGGERGGGMVTQCMSQYCSCCLAHISILVDNVQQLLRDHWRVFASEWVSVLIQVLYHNWRGRGVSD